MKDQIKSEIRTRAASRRLPIPVELNESASESKGYEIKVTSHLEDGTSFGFSIPVPSPSAGMTSEERREKIETAQREIDAQLDVMQEAMWRESVDN